MSDRATSSATSDALAATSTTSAFSSGSAIRTARLTLVPATAPHVRAELDSIAQFSELLDADVPASWPPGQYDRDAQEYFLQSLVDGGADAIGWFGWYALKNDGSARRPSLVGSGGYFGPPGSDGTVEIGYSICPEWNGQGLATEMARALTQRVQSVSNVRRVIAHTHPDNLASIAVLKRSGFVQVHPSDQSDALLFKWTETGDYLKGV